jgi:2-polyprenyl-3-methyl-5-hydroxy-6-metoxy-1,4-benzoquinol methylase
MTTYAIRGGEEGTRRLDLLSRVVGPTTESFLDAAGIAAGMSCLDAGSGAGHVSRSLARRVGPSGRVVGLERDPVKLAAARSETEREGLRNLEYREADVTTWSEPEAYDVVYGRFIVSHLRDRPAFVRRLWQSLSAPGTLILEDIDFSGAFCYPADHRRGGDANVGPRLYGLCLAAGFAELDVQVVQPTHCGTCQEKELSLSTMVNIADAVVAEKLAGAEEVRETIARLTALTTDPGSIVACPRIFQVRGRKVSP